MKTHRHPSHHTTHAGLCSGTLHVVHSLNNTYIPTTVPLAKEAVLCTFQTQKPALISWSERGGNTSRGAIGVFCCCILSFCHLLSWFWLSFVLRFIFIRFYYSLPRCHSLFFPRLHILVSFVFFFLLVLFVAYRLLFYIVILWSRRTRQGYGTCNW